MLVGLAYPYLPSVERDTLAIDYIIRGMNSTALQKHFFKAGTSMVGSTVLAIEEYLPVGDTERPSCKATGEEVSSQQMEQRVHAHNEVAVPPRTMPVRVQVERQPILCFVREGPHIKRECPA